MKKSTVEPKDTKRIRMLLGTTAGLDKEEEAGLREIVREELRTTVKLPIETCTPGEFAKNPVLAVGAEVIAPNHALQYLVSVFPQSRSFLPVTYSGVKEHVDVIRQLDSASVIAVVSISQSLLKTSRGPFAL